MEGSLLAGLGRDIAIVLKVGVDTRSWRAFSLGAIWACFALCGGVAYGQAIEKPVQAIIGEAESEPYLGKVAIGEALRNRKSFKGVYGLNSPRIRTASTDLVRICQQAWQDSASTNLVGGATVWGNASDVVKFKKQKWFKNMVFVTQIGGHFFYKERSKR